jgi:hypothetical protein
MNSLCSLCSGGFLALALVTVTSCLGLVGSVLDLALAFPCLGKLHPQSRANQGGWAAHPVPHLTLRQQQLLELPSGQCLTLLTLFPQPVIPLVLNRTGQNRK